MTSPLKRAVQTAEIIATGVGLNKKEIKQSGNLAPGAPAKQLFGEIKTYAGVEAIALIGHQPDLGALIRESLRVMPGRFRFN